MGIFQRISDILKSNINDLIDKAENPEKMVKQIIRDLQSDVQEATEAYGKALASQRMTQRQYENAVKQSADWESKAKAALASGNTELAKSALSNKVKTDAQVEQYSKMCEDITAQVNTIKMQVDSLKQKLDEAKSREAMLIARAQMADTKKNLAKTSGSLNTDNSFEKFNRMEEKIARKEAEADAFAEISGSGNMQNADTFEKLENDAKVDAELQRLMNEMNGNQLEMDKN